MSRRIRQRGSALMVAMLIVTLAVLSASAAIEQQDLALSRLESARDYEQAVWVLRGGTHWARAILADDAGSSAADHSSELWASGLAPTAVERGTLSGEILDQQALFNLANLTRDGKPSERDVAALGRLLALIGLRAGLADAIAAAQPIHEVEELRRVQGCDEATVAHLRRFATVLPQRTPVNVNTASPEVLVAAIDGLALAEALVIAQAAKTSPVRHLSELAARLPRIEQLAEGANITVQSRFFLVQGRALIGKADVRVQALLQRDGAALPRIVWQRTS